MKLGILGTDQRIAGVAAAAAARGDVFVSSVAGEGPAELLDPANCDAVLVGSDGWDATRAEAVRMLVQTGRPLLVSQPLEQSMLWAWELEMIRQDAGGPIVPLLPERLHPFLLRLRRILEASVAGGGPLGGLESVVLDRRQADRRRGAVLATLARDADLIRTLVGEPARVSALGAAADDLVWNSLTVGFTAPASVPVRWQIAGGGEPLLRISLLCAGGTVEVEIPDDWSQSWRWLQPGVTVESPQFDPGGAILGVLDAALGRDAVPPARGEDDVPPASGEDAVPPASWADASRAIELADTVPRSLARGRGIDLHQEEFSELGTFRGTMASLGCGIILAALLLVVMATLVGGIANEFGWDFGGRLAGTWPIVALVVLGGFLVLQFLPLIVAGSRRHE
jgi:predicted dehydrogenase